MKVLFRSSFVAVLLAGVVLGGVGSDAVSTEASAASGGLSVSGVAVAPRVVSAAAGDGFAQVTIADMSPDTGVYAVQWVPVGQGFNSFSMYRTTTKTMTVPYLSCTRTYTLRVFVMQENWQMSDGFVNQNVTPHSATFDLTMPACRDVATTVAAGCATTYCVGDTGPGGGIVFYVHASGTFACGATLTSQCKYLEAAPANWLTGTTGDPDRTWATDITNNRTTSVLGADGTAIGSGYQNSLDIVAQTGNVAATSAAVEARAYRGPNNLTDWHLPSKDELNQLYTQKTMVGGFSDVNYWSSSETVSTDAWYQNFPTGNQSDGGGKGSPLYVRPVRAFG